MSDKKSQQFKTWCHIIDYVETIDPEYAELLRGTCTVGNLTTRRSEPGITLLIPQDKAVRDEIKRLSYSTKVEDVDKAAAMINAMIIKDALKTPADWNAHKDDLPNSLLPSQHVEIVSAVDGSKPTVTFKSGAKAVPDDGFVDRSHKRKYAVWKITGSIPITTDKPATFKYHKRTRTGSGAASGAYDGGNDSGFSGGFDVARQMEKDKRVNLLVQILQGAYEWTKHKKEPYLKFFTGVWVKLISLLVQHDPVLFFDLIFPLSDLTALGLIALIEPFYVTDRPNLIPSHIIDKMLEGGSYKMVDVRALIKAMHGMGKFPTKELDDAFTPFKDLPFYARKQEILTEIFDVSEQIHNVLQAKPRAAVDHIIKAYQELESGNKIGNVNQVFPPGAHAFIRANPGYKMMFDEVSYLGANSINYVVRRIATSSFGDMLAAVQPMVDMLAARDKDTRSISHVLVSNRIKTAIAPGEHMQDLTLFVMSAQFMHVSGPKEMYEPWERRSKQVYTIAKSAGLDVALRAYHYLEMHSHSFDREVVAAVNIIQEIADNASQYSATQLGKLLNVMNDAVAKLKPALDAARARGDDQPRPLSSSSTQFTGMRADDDDDTIQYY